VSSNPTQKHECLCVRLFCVYVVLCTRIIAALRRADHSSKESYSLCTNDYGTEKEFRAQQRAVGQLINEMFFTIDIKLVLWKCTQVCVDGCLKYLNARERSRSETPCY
jgi:hypothetical protein